MVTTLHNGIITYSGSQKRAETQEIEDLLKQATQVWFQAQSIASRVKSLTSYSGQHLKDHLDIVLDTQGKLDKLFAYLTQTFDQLTNLCNELIEKHGQHTARQYDSVARSPKSRKDSARSTLSITDLLGDY